MKIQGIKIQVRDHRPSVLLNAIDVADDYTASPLVIERAMKALFQHDFISPEVVATYNRLEKKWKILTNYRVNENRAVSFKE